MPVYLLYGEDTFSSRRKLKEIKSRFFDANMGDINITNLEGVNLTLEKIKRAICLVPFLAPKRLIVVSNLLTQGQKEVKEKVAEILSTVPEFAIVIFREEGEVDKSLGIFRKLRLAKKIDHFPLLSSQKLNDWVEKEVQKREGRIQPEAICLLTQITGPDLWRLSLEIDKLIAYRNGQTIEKEDVKELVKEEVDPNIFVLIDSLGHRDIKKAYSLLSELLSSGENESYILSMIAYQFRNLIILRDLIENKKPLSQAGLHPFVLEKAKRQVQNFSLDQLKLIHGKLVETDLHIKRGTLKPYLALDLLISEFAK
ncbi:MAG: DNA polymerase III subunit delta [Candidatus Berkelbacteria bacterium]|nr:DNA polymerase III subunit delta [Candidatus Berkelbacteria bacterium]